MITDRLYRFLWESMGITMSSSPLLYVTRVLRARGAMVSCMIVTLADVSLKRWPDSRLWQRNNGPGVAPTVHHEGNVNVAVQFSSEEAKNASHPWPTYLTHCTLSRPLVFLSPFLPVQQNQQQWGHGVKRQARNIVAQRSSASRFCAECWSHIRRGRQQPRYTKRMSAIVAPSVTGGASVVGAGVARRLPPPRYPIRRHLCSVSSLLFFSRSRTIVLPPLPQPHRPSSLPSYPRIPLPSPCTLRSLSPSRSLYRGSHHRLRYRLAQLSLVRARQSLQHPNGPPPPSSPS